MIQIKQKLSILDNSQSEGVPCSSVMDEKRNYT